MNYWSRSGGRSSAFLPKERKVRAPHSGVAGNARPLQNEDQSHRDESFLRERVKRGNLYAEQGQIGKESEKSGTCGWTGAKRLVSPYFRVGCTSLIAM